MNWFTKVKSALGLGVTQTTETTNEMVAPTNDYSSMKVAELKAAAKEKGIKGYYRLRKSELIDALTKN